MLRNSVIAELSREFLFKHLNRVLSHIQFSVFPENPSDDVDTTLWTGDSKKMIRVYQREYVKFFPLIIPYMVLHFLRAKVLFFFPPNVGVFSIVRQSIPPIILQD